MIDKLAIALLLVATPAFADDRPFHGSVGAGGTLLLTGMNGGSRLRVEGEIDLEPGGAWSRYGALLAIRAADKDHHGLLCGGLIFEAAASRPRLVVDLHADLGVDLDEKAPVVGGGVRWTLTIWKFLGVSLDNGAHLVIDGVDHTRLVLGGSTNVVVRW